MTKFKMKKVRIPEFKLGPWQLQYKQVPFDDRYLIIKYNGNQIMKCRGYLWREGPLFDTIFPFDLHSQLYDSKRYNKFIERVGKYEKFLNNS